MRGRGPGGQRCQACELARITCFNNLSSKIGLGVDSWHKSCADMVRTERSGVGACDVCPHCKLASPHPCLPRLSPSCLPRLSPSCRPLGPARAGSVWQALTQLFDRFLTATFMLLSGVPIEALVLQVRGYLGDTLRPCCCSQETGFVETLALQVRGRWQSAPDQGCR